MGISCAIMVFIFGGQRFGTSKIGFTYAPILLIWFFSNAAVGVFNIATAYPAIFKASPSDTQTYTLIVFWGCECLSMIHRCAVMIIQ